MSLAVLNDWLDAHGVKRSDGLDVVKGDSGLSVIATRDHEMGEILCQVPKTALLSHRTSSLPRLLDTVDNTQLTSHSVLHLALVILHEFRLGQDSSFWGYLQSLPQEAIPLPAFWDMLSIGGEDGPLALEILRGTEAERDMRLKSAEGLSMDDLRQFYTVLAPKMPPTAKCPDPSPFIDFIHAYSLVCTRAFRIDLWHTIALCPFADLLNHSSTGAHTSLSADDFVCHMCGSLRECEHDIVSTTGVAMRLAHLPDSELARLKLEADTVDLRVDRQAIEAGDEVFNSYGDDMGDGRILVEWGFVEEDSAEARITFDASELGHGTEAWEQLLKDDTDRLFNVLLSTLGHSTEDRLLRPVPVHGVNMYDLDPDGTLGVGVFAALIFGLRDAGALRLERLEEALGDLVKWHNGWSEEVGDNDTGTVDPLVVQTARLIVDLVDRRLQSLYRPDAGIDELYEQRDALPPAGRLRHMALLVMINERRLLETTREVWTELGSVDKRPA